MSNALHSRHSVHTPQLGHHQQQQQQQQQQQPSITEDETKARPLRLLRTAHYVVLGRYNGKKTRPLTPATRIYRTVRKGIRRTKNLSTREIQEIKTETTRLVRQDKGQHLPEVVFCVDVERIGATNVGFNTKLQFISCLDYDGEEVFLVKDVDDEFLKKDIDSKRHSEKASTSRKEPEKRAPPKRLSITSTSSTLTTSASTVVSDSLSSATTTTTTPTATTTPLPLFQLQLGGGVGGGGGGGGSSNRLEEQLETIFVQWIGQEPGLREAVKRKTKLVESYKRYFRYYQSLLEHYNPLVHSQVPQLQIMNERLLVQFANQLGNSMVAWYHQYPNSCLRGEQHSWAAAGEPEIFLPWSSLDDSSIGIHDDASSWGYSPSDDDFMMAAFSECSMGSPNGTTAASRKTKIQTPFEDAASIVVPPLNGEDSSSSIGGMSTSMKDEMGLGSSLEGMALDSDEGLLLDLEGEDTQQDVGTSSRSSKRSLKIWNRSKGWHRLDS